eukprot:8014361-Pyramimonas_sp.AAC.1
MSERRSASALSKSYGLPDHLPIEDFPDLLRLPTAEVFGPSMAPSRSVLHTYLDPFGHIFLVGRLAAVHFSI